MRLATVPGPGPDGTLVVVSTDLSRAASARSLAPTLQEALDQWEMVEPRLAALAAELETGAVGAAFDPGAALAPLPRAWQWLDGSAFPVHGELMAKAFGVVADSGGKPLMYQGLSDHFIAPRSDVPFVSEEDGIDFEGEFGVIIDETPMGISAQAAANRIRLVVMINDWSLRTIAQAEARTAFGWVQSKPACSMAPIAVTPEALGEAWRDSRVHLPLSVRLNDGQIGRANGGEMAFGFHELIAHAARTRRLPAGTVIGSGTIANTDFAAVGSSCLTEVRMIEKIRDGEIRTSFLRFGDHVQMEAQAADGSSPFGAIDQHVVRAA